MLIIKRECKYETIPPKKWKNNFTLGTGRAEQKKNSIKLASKIVGEELKSDDIADSILLLQFALDNLRAT